MNLVILLTSALLALGAAVSGGSLRAAAGVTASAGAVAVPAAPTPTPTPAPPKYDILGGGGPTG